MDTLDKEKNEKIEERYEKADNETRENYMAIGMCLGISIGMAVGIAMGHMAIGMSLGLCIGMAVGIAIKKK